jgi:transcriptional antiterminator NusG
MSEDYTNSIADIEEELEDEAVAADVEIIYESNDSVNTEEDDAENDKPINVNDDYKNEMLDEEDDVYDDSDESTARWYVVHTYSGHEAKVKSSIEKLIEGYKDDNVDGTGRTMSELIQKVTVPMHDVMVQKEGQSKIKSRKMFPGYVLVKMVVTNKSWYLVRNTQGVTGFVGYDSRQQRNKPVPLTKEEVRRMGIEKVYIELDIKVGDSIKVINGPFESFTGIVEEVYPEKETLKARISMFGRDTPVELVYDQVDKLYR